MPLKRPLALLASPLVLALVSAPSHGATVTQHFTANISGFKGSGWNAIVGDTVSFSATYDDASTAYHTYDNGLNGLDDGGGGDDTLAQTVPLGSSHSLYGDATFDLTDLMRRVSTESSAWKDVHDSSYSYLTQFTVGDGLGTIMEQRSDGFTFSADHNTNASTALFRYANGGTWETLYMQDVVSTQVSPVPLPAAAWLFGSALLGLAGMRKYGPK